MLVTTANPYFKMLPECSSRTFASKFPEIKSIRDEALKVINEEREVCNWDDKKAHDIIRASSKADALASLLVKNIGSGGSS